MEDSISPYTTRTPDYAKRIPVHILHSISNYIFIGTQPGGFLTKCLENDLFGAMMQADEQNLKVMRDICVLMHESLPACSWGNKGIVRHYCSSDAVHKKIIEDAMRGARDFAWLLDYGYEHRRPQ